MNPRWSISLSLTLVAFFLVAVPSTLAADMLRDQLKKNNARQDEIEQQLKRLDTREQQVQNAIEAANTKINAIQVPIQKLDSDIENLKLQMTNRRNRIAELRVQYKEQAKLIRRLGTEVSIARERMTERAVEVYKAGESDTGAWIVGATSIADAFERKDAVSHILANDKDILAKIENLERKIRVKRARNHSVRASIVEDIQQLKADEAELAAQRAELARKKAELDQAQAERSRFLRQVRGKQSNLDEEFDDLEANSEAVYEAIKSGASSLGASALPSGGSPGAIAWPVNGPVVSPFGPRWGRLHAGIDIAVPAGVPIHAAAPGIVTYSGWMSGYGNMVIIQHAGALSTGYAHQSRIGVGKGTFVTQGMVIGYIGCTGHCFGDHLHFETRVNGSPANPMNYL